MFAQRRLSTALASTTLAGSLVCAAMVVPSPAAFAAADTCLGKPVTIVATDSVTTGTEGDDVVSMTPHGWTHFEAGGGNDTICLAVGGPNGSQSPNSPPTTVLDAGAGDDVVVNLTPSGSDGRAETRLGSGNDTYTGANLNEVVWADQYFDQYSNNTPGEVSDSTFSGSQRDNISRVLEVYSFAPSDGPNQDQISFGSRGAQVFLDGPMGPQGSLKFPAKPGGDDNDLTVVDPDAFRVSGPGDVKVDNVNRRVTVAGVPVLTWSGEVASFTLGRELNPPRPSKVGQRPISFSGSAADEYVYVAFLPVGDVSLGRGDDALDTNRGGDVVPRSLDGGPGDDQVDLFMKCGAMVLRLEHAVTCDGRSGTVAGFESTIVSLLPRGSSKLTLIGTRAKDYLNAYAGRVIVRGRGGSDDIEINALTARAFGAAGRDRIRAYGRNVLLRGGSGPDRIDLSHPPYDDLPGFGKKTQQQVALGGPGNDILIGNNFGDVRDRLIGGPGRDTAHGKAGKRDYCFAEVTTGCERP